MHQKLLKKIKQSLHTAPFTGDIHHARYKKNGNKDNKDILIHNIPYLFTCDETEKLRCFENYSIKVSKGIIKEAVSAKKINPKKYSQVYDAGMRGGIVATPGFINVHSHIHMYLLRSAMMLDEEESVDETIKSMGEWQRNENEESYAFASVGDITEQQKSGITTTLTHGPSFFSAEAAASATKHNLINALSAVSNSRPENSPEMVRKILKEKGNYLSIPAISLHYLFKASPKVLKQVKEIMTKDEILLTFHMAESEEVAEQTLRRHRLTETEIMEKYGFLNRKSIASHVLYVKPKEIEKLIKGEVGIAHLPTSNTIHKSGTFHFWEFREKGGFPIIALGTDSVVSKSRQDLLSEAYQARITHLYSRAIKFGSLFKMMTVNGARVLNMPDRGRVLPGMKADIAFWKLKDRGFIPYDEKNPMSLLGNLITHGGRMVRDLMINGEFVVTSRRHQLINETKLMLILQKKHMEMRKRVLKSNFCGKLKNK